MPLLVADGTWTAGVAGGATPFPLPHHPLLPATCYSSPFGFVVGRGAVDSWFGFTILLPPAYAVGSDELPPPVTLRSFPPCPRSSPATTSFPLPPSPAFCCGSTLRTALYAAHHAAFDDNGDVAWRVCGAWFARAPRCAHARRRLLPATWVPVVVNDYGWYDARTRFMLVCARAVGLRCGLPSIVPHLLAV